MSRVLVIGWGAVAPEKPVRPLGYTGPWDWREDAWDSLYSALDASVLFFFHALVALIVTAWLLRARAGFDLLRVLRRAVRGAGLLTCAAAVVFAAAYLVDDALPATRYVRFNFSAAAMVALWFGASALLLPARLMGHQPAAAAGFVRTTVLAALALLPWFHISEGLGAPLRHCYDNCGGMFFAGLDYLAFLGAYLLGLTVISAAVSAAACLPAETQPAAPVILSRVDGEGPPAIRADRAFIGG
jgi:hypothetical protein